MRVYIITEEQKQTLFKELELEALKAKDGYLIFNGEQLPPAQFQSLVAQEIHRKMIYHVCVALDKAI